MIVNKNSNQSQALKLVCLHMCYFFVLLLTKPGKCAICVCLYLRFAKTIVVYKVMTKL